MFKRLNHLALASIGLIVALASVSEAFAQCSGGRGGGAPTTSSPASFSPIVSSPIISSTSPNTFAYQQVLMQQRGQMYAMQQQMMQQQAQLAAVQRQMMQRNVEEQYAKLQEQHKKQLELVALRKEHAEQKRSEQAEKIAAFKAKRDAEKFDTGEAASTMRFVSTKLPSPALTEMAASDASIRPVRR